MIVPDVLLIGMHVYLMRLGVKMSEHPARLAAQTTGLAVNKTWLMTLLVGLAVNVIG